MPGKHGVKAPPPLRTEGSSNFWKNSINSSQEQHPGLQILVDLADMQDQEVGDGTTSVVIFAAELLQRANNLVRHKIHPTSIISGYRLAMREVGHRNPHFCSSQSNVNSYRKGKGGQVPSRSNKLTM